MFYCGLKCHVCGAEVHLGCRKMRKKSHFLHIADRKNGKTIEFCH